MTDSPDFRFRADLFRVAARFASMSAGVRIEPAQAGGVLLAGWTDDLAFAALDPHGHAKQAAQVRVPFEFVDATTRAIRSANGETVRIAIAGGEATCDFVSLRASNCVRPASPDHWRAWCRRQAGAPLMGALDLRRDFLAAIADAAQLLARAGGANGFDADRAPLVFCGGREGAIVVEFPLYPNAFVVVRDVIDARDDPGKWEAPAWLEGESAPEGPAPEAGVTL